MAAVMTLTFCHTKLNSVGKGKYLQIASNGRTTFEALEACAKNLSSCKICRHQLSAILARHVTRQREKGQCAYGNTPTSDFAK